MDYAVKEIKLFDPGSCAIERKILALGNSTWNLFLSSLCGEFFYQVCLNQIPLDYLRCPNFSSLTKQKKVKRLKRRNLDKCIQFITTDVRLCMHYRYLPCANPPPPPHNPILLLPLEISLRFAFCPLLPVEGVTGNWYSFGCNCSKTYILWLIRKNGTKLCLKARWWPRDLAARVFCCCVENTSSTT